MPSISNRSNFHSNRNLLRMAVNFDIIVPYRDRESHLKRFVPYYTRLFPDARIIIVEQDNDKPFNRGWLLNVGFHFSGSEYVIFHDVDMLVSHGHRHYLIPPDRPVHLATHAQQFGYRMPFPEYFGGVTMFNRMDFLICNGYSNKFNGWGGEDNEIYDHLKRMDIPIGSRDCWHQSLPHEREFSGMCLPPDHPNYIYWKKGRDADDGLTNCRFRIVSSRLDTRVSHIRVDAHLKEQTIPGVPA